MNTIEEILDQIKPLQIGRTPKELHAKKQLAAKWRKLQTEAAEQHANEVKIHIEREYRRQLLFLVMNQNYKVEDAQAEALKQAEFRADSYNGNYDKD